PPVRSQEAPHRLPQAGLALGDVVQQPAGQLLAFPEEAPSLPEAVVRLVDHRLRELPRPQGEHLHAPEAGQPLLQTPGVPANLLRLTARLLLPPELAFELVEHLHVDQLPFGPRHPEGLPVDLQPLRVEGDQLVQEIPPLRSGTEAWLPHPPGPLS